MNLRFRGLGGVLLTLLIGGGVWEGGSLAMEPTAVKGAAEIDFDGRSTDGSKSTVNVTARDRETGVVLEGVLEVTFENSNTRVVTGELGDIVWESDGRTISGRIIGPAGQEVAELTGVVEDGAMSGDFKDAAGRIGTWHWTGELPAQD